jgi:hypothetical protein
MRMKRRYQFILMVLVLLFPYSAYAYLDPGTGSMLVTSLIGLVAALFFFIKNIYYTGVTEVLAFLGIRKEKIEKHDIVIYSEGKQYWNVFKPVLQELEKRDVSYLFLTSDIEDPVLKKDCSLIQRAKYIGKGNKAYAHLNFVEATVCLMTTPGLNVLQIKRSPGVMHYVHLVHSPVDIHSYKLYSFDYFDSIFVSGEHQKNTLRTLENIRGTNPKKVVPVGCTYFDELIRRKATKKSNGTNVLVAPSWGKNGLLTKFGIDLLLPLLNENFNIVIRPHPQTYISELTMISNLEKKLEKYENFSWDRSNDNSQCMRDADIMISDFSGIIFDFVFVYEKPVLSLDFKFDPLGLEADELDGIPWEYSIFEKLGRRVKENEIEQIPTIIKSYQLNEKLSETAQKIREESVYNFGSASSAVVDNLIGILKTG